MTARFSSGGWPALSSHLTAGAAPQVGQRTPRTLSWCDGFFISGIMTTIYKEKLINCEHILILNLGPKPQSKVLWQTPFGISHPTHSGVL
jgi:hypothetical protein